MNNRSLYVTDAGSVKLGTALYHPGMEIPMEAFKGRESALREHILSGRISNRRRKMRTDGHGRVIKIDRSSGAMPLPSELSEYDPKSRREVRPLKSEIVGAHEIRDGLEKLRREQDQKKVDEANAAQKKAEESLKNPAQPKEEPAPSKEEMAKLSEIADAAVESVSDEDDVFEDDGDGLFEEDVELLQELDKES